MIKRDSLFTENFNDRIQLTPANETMWFNWAIDKNYNKTTEYKLLGKAIALPLGDTSPVLEVLVNTKCNHNCRFCIEDATMRNRCGIMTIEEHCEMLAGILRDANAQGLTPSVTFTGGEPLLSKQRLLQLMETVRKFKIKNFGMNTNAKFLVGDKDYKEVFSRYFNDEAIPFHINISRHHYDDEVNENLFGSSKAISLQELAELNKTFNGRLSIQLVMCKDYIGTLTELQKFLDAFIERGFMNFNLRGVAKLSTTVGNRDNKIDFCNDNQVDLIKIINDITKSSKFSFRRQSIGNNSLHEFFSYRGANLKFIYGNNDCFRLYDEKHVKKGGNTIASILILLPTGAFFRNWNYDISRIEKTLHSLRLEGNSLKLFLF